MIADPKMVAVYHGLGKGWRLASPRLPPLPGGRAGPLLGFPVARRVKSGASKSVNRGTPLQRPAEPGWRSARSRRAFRFLVGRRARLASPRSGFYVCSCKLVLSLGFRLRNSSQPDHPMLSLCKTTLVRPESYQESPSFLSSPISLRPKYVRSRHFHLIQIPLVAVTSVEFVCFAKICFRQRQ